MSAPDTEQNEFVSLTAEIVSAYLGHNHVSAADLPSLIQNVHAALTSLTAGSAAEAASMQKATAAEIRRSITPDHLVSFEDGKRYKTLRRHLTLRDLSPEQYRAKWGLPADYPMTAANYSAQRAQLARSRGLGRQHRTGLTRASPDVAQQTEAFEEQANEPLASKPDQMTAGMNSVEEALDAITREPFEDDSAFE
jgi:predicted transcriptional regulator